MPPVFIPIHTFALLHPSLGYLAYAQHGSICFHFVREDFVLVDYEDLTPRITQSA